MIKTNTKTQTMANTNTFRLTLTHPSHPKDKEEVKDNEHLQRGIMEIFGNTENFHTSDNRERQYIASLLTSSYP